jgi:hypothetical protein
MNKAQQLVKEGGIGASIIGAKDTVKGYIKSGVNSKAGQYINNAIDSGAKRVGFKNGAGTAKQKLMVGGGLATAGIGGAMLSGGTQQNNQKAGGL